MAARARHPRFSASLALARAMADAGEERQRRMTRAVDEFGIDTATAWSLDLPNGSIRFMLPDRDVVGSAALIGVYSKIGKTFTWGWSVDSLPLVLPGIDEATEPVVTLSDAQADGLAQLAFVRGDGAFLYRAFGPAADTYVSVGDLWFEDRV